MDSRKKFWVKLEGSIVKWLFMSCALVSILTTLGILVILLYQGYGFFKEIGIWEFLTGTRWTPILKPRSYGVLPLVSGTLIVTVIAALVALPPPSSSQVGLSAGILIGLRSRILCTRPGHVEDVRGRSHGKPRAGGSPWRDVSKLWKACWEI